MAAGIIDKQPLRCQSDARKAGLKLEWCSQLTQACRLRSRSEPATRMKLPVQTPMILVLLRSLMQECHGFTIELFLDVEKAADDGNVVEAFRISQPCCRRDIDTAARPDHVGRGTYYIPIAQAPAGIVVDVTGKPERIDEQGKRA